MAQRKGQGMRGITCERLSVHAIIAGLTLIMAITFVGCGGPEAMRISGNEGSAIKQEDSAAYLDRIGTVKCINQNDAFRGLLLLLDGKDECADFSSRVNKLESRGIVSRSWSFDAGESLSRGKMAYMVCQACGIKGGVMLSLLGPNQRYCLRELQDRRIVVKNSMTGEVTGLEYIAVLNRADSYIRTGRVSGKPGP